MQPSYFFYDLETSGRDYKRHRIMQFAGRRTTLDLQPIGEPINLLVRLADDVLPEPEAVLITGITPQASQEGITEAELVKRLHAEVLTPGTTMIGFNNVRFDDEYLRFTFYRNFHDPYAWSWKDGRGRWDVLDVVRMTRALRPQNISWPCDENDDPINTLVELAKTNNLDHFKAHDAMSDVEALIGLAKVIKDAQPKLWNYALTLRGKDAVAAVIKPNRPEPFVYTNGMYGREHDFTTVAGIIGEERAGTYYVFDLRFDPAAFMDLTPDELHVRLFTKREELAALGLQRLPVKTLSTNKCPAVAPLGTLVPEAAARLELDIAQCQANWRALTASGLPAKILAAYRSQDPYPVQADPDGALYDGFVNDDAACAQVRAASELNIDGIAPKFTDSRLDELFLRYKGRNFPGQLSPADHERWEAYRTKRILADIEPWSNTLQDKYAIATPAQQLILADLQLWAESIYPAEI